MFGEAVKERQRKGGTSVKINVRLIKLPCNRKKRGRAAKTALPLTEIQPVYCTVNISSFI